MKEMRLKSEIAQRTLSDLWREDHAMAQNLVYYPPFSTDREALAAGEIARVHKDFTLGEEGGRLPKLGKSLHLIVF